jgi:chromosome segregation ATPase
MVWAMVWRAKRQCASIARVMTTLLFAALALGGTAGAQPRHEPDLAAEIAELSRTHEDLAPGARSVESARGSLEMAGRAIVQARNLLRQGQRAGAERASQIAAAALALAAKQVALESTRARLREAERRSTAVVEQADQARRALEAVLERRAAATPARAPSAPSPGEPPSEPAPNEMPGEAGAD